jgi:Alpha-galactosidases/6-phospho-beta-glucosidases, family 4 of glycosyl hydrolases
VIFAALRVGGLDGRVADERSALDAGVIGQETVGAGGLAYAVRAVPVVDAIARRVAELAPQAWVISMTNPAGIVTEVMAATLGPRVIGVCDSPMGLVRRACTAAGVDPGARLAQVPDGVDVDYLGLNHLGWLRGLRVNGTDRLPGLLADPDALERTEEGRLFGADLLQARRDPERVPVLVLRPVRGAAGRAGPAGRGPSTSGPSSGVLRGRRRGPGRAAALWAAANDERNRSYFAELALR